MIIYLIMELFRRKLNNSENVNKCVTVIQLPIKQFKVYWD